MNVSKLLVVDKSVFHALYQCDDKLCAFAKKYNVVLPNALAAECLISENQDLSKNPGRLLRGLDKAIKAGAKMGYPSFKLFGEENQTLRPAKSVVDESTTKQIRNGILNTEADFIEQEAECCRKKFEPMMKGLLETAGVLYKNLCKRDKLAVAVCKVKDRMRRFENWIDVTDQKMKDILSHLFSKQIASHADANWFTWQLSRLYFAYSLDLMFIKNLPGSCVKKDISNDFYDIEPVLYLSRADGLLTNDKKLQVPLAKAAFKAKEVFEVSTSLDTSRTVQHVFDDIVSKIPASYRIE